jgi:hypothetical protein
VIPNSELPRAHVRTTRWRRPPRVRVRRPIIHAQSLLVLVFVLALLLQEPARR